MSKDVHEKLTTAVLEVLQRHPDGISEYEFMKYLEVNFDASVINQAFDTNHSLFKAHFLLFHILYKLRSEQWEQQAGHLEISPLKIQLLPYESPKAGLDVYDELSEYYLDISHLENTTADEVDQLIGSFYRHLSGFSKRQWALSQLGLADPVDDDTIRKTYRRLAMKHHPDRGGDHEAVQLINEAAKILLRDQSKS